MRSVVSHLLTWVPLGPLGTVFPKILSSLGIERIALNREVVPEKIFLIH